MADFSRDSYEFKYTKRGRAVIISNGKFWPGKGYPYRRGAKVDTKRMKKLFTRLGFSVKDYQDLTAGEMLDTLDKVAENEKKLDKEKKDGDCFVCVISSHGQQEAEVEERDGVREIHRQQSIAGVDGKTVKLKTLIDLFEDGNCKSLKDKPKLFFIQACRSNVGVGKEHNEGWDVGMEIPSDADKTQTNHSDNIDAKALSDCQEVLSDSEYDTSDADPDSDYDDPDYQLQKPQSVHKNDEIKEASTKDENLMEGQKETTTNDNNLMEGQKSTKDQTLMEEQTEASGDNIAQRQTENNIQTTEKIEDAGDTIDVVGLKGNSRIVKSQDVIDLVSVPCYTDMLIMYATPAGKFAISSATGSWLPSTLYVAMKDNEFKLENKDFLSFLIEVVHLNATEMGFSPSKKAEKIQCPTLRVGSSEATFAKSELEEYTDG